MAQTFYLPVRVIQGNGCLVQIGQVVGRIWQKSLARLWPDSDARLRRS